MADKVQWEYRVKTFGATFHGEKDEDLEAALNDWGIDGWEIVSARGVENTSKVVIIAKRPLTTATRRRRSLPI